MRISKWIMGNNVASLLFMTMMQNGIWIAFATVLMSVPAFVWRSADVFAAIVGILSGIGIGLCIGCRLIAESMGILADARKYYDTCIYNGDKLLEDAESVKNTVNEICKDHVEQFNKIKDKPYSPEQIMRVIDQTREKIAQACVDVAAVYHEDGFTEGQIDFLFERIDFLVRETKNLNDYKLEQKYAEQSNVSQAST